MIKSIILIIISVLLGVIGQVSLKQGMVIVTQSVRTEQADSSNNGEKADNTTGGAVKRNLYLLLKALFHPRVMFGIFCYGFSMLIWLLILSRVDLSFAYPMLGMSYILVVMSSWLILNEPVSFSRWLGTFIISLGVILVARS